jgi:hypothetical protein
MRTYVFFVVIQINAIYVPKLNGFVIEKQCIMCEVGSEMLDRFCASPREAAAATCSLEEL